MPSGSTRLLRRAGVGAGSLLVILASGAASQGPVKLNKVSTTVSGLGAVNAQSPLKKTNRVPGSGGDLWVEGTVTTTHVGPYQLQARLSAAINDTVKVYVPPSTTVLTKLSTTTWTTIAMGPGGPNKVNAVAFLVKWGKGGPKNPAVAEAIPVIYQVIP